jgi:hypothetical protein
LSDGFQRGPAIISCQISSQWIAVQRCTSHRLGSSICSHELRREQQRRSTVSAPIWAFSFDQLGNPFSRAMTS